jgi:hypothetical protein
VGLTTPYRKNKFIRSLKPGQIPWMGRACSMNAEKRNAYRILMGKPEGKKPLGR